jgi:hypothetical protein
MALVFVNVNADARNRDLVMAVEELQLGYGVPVMNVGPNILMANANMGRSQERDEI